MSVITSKTVAFHQEREIILYRLMNASGAYIEILNYGAILVSACVPDKYGELENVVLGYDRPEDYFSDPFYLGSTVGRFANRITGARFTLEGETFDLEKNDGENSIHGGLNGFNRQVFNSSIAGDSIVLTLESEDGSGGYPGNLQFLVIYTFTENNELEIEYQAVSDRATILNPTNHAYFNLSAGRRSGLQHELKVYSGHYLESNDFFLPTGNILPVSGTAFDFGEYQQIDRMMPLKKEIIRGYNACFVIGNESGMELRPAASLRDSESGRVLDVYTTMPGILFYSGDYLSEPFHAFDGVCLEAQFFPDAPNHSHFPSCILQPGIMAVHRIKYQFL